MAYRFPLTLLYRANYKDKAWVFRPLSKRDLRAVSKWTAAAVDASGRWRRGYRRLLEQEYSTTAGLSQPLSWMVTVNNKCTFWLEALEVEDSSFSGVQIFLTGPPHLMDDDRGAYIIWSRAVAFLGGMDPAPAPGAEPRTDKWSQFRVQLDLSRVTEALVLLKMGFHPEGEYYVR